MHFVKILIKDTRKFNSFLDNFAVPNKTIILILRLLMCFLKVLPLTAVKEEVRGNNFQLEQEPSEHLTSEFNVAWIIVSPEFAGALLALYDQRQVDSSFPIS